MMPPRPTRLLRALWLGRRARRVDFIVAGVQKGGTSALDAYLRTHPQLCLPRGKEVHFFDDDRYFRLPNRAAWAAYHAHFDPRPEHRLVGETTPIYVYWKEAAPRMRAYHPALRLILLLRNPIERAFSHWNMERQRRTEPLPFWEALQQEEARCRAVLPAQHRNFSYTDRGFYARQIERLQGYFPADQILVLRCEALRADPNAVLAEIATFLGLDPFPRAEPRTLHARKYPAGMTDRERAFLRELYEPDIRALERMRGWDLSDWLA
jgi:hypothetical protein